MKNSTATTKPIVPQRNLCEVRRSLAVPKTKGLPAVRQSQTLQDRFSRLAEPKIETRNLSKFERTKKLYGSLVENVANLKKFKESNFKDPRS
jgi:hypothetical protein